MELSFVIMFIKMSKCSYATFDNSLALKGLGYSIFAIGLY